MSICCILLVIIILIVILLIGFVGKKFYDKINNVIDNKNKFDEISENINTATATMNTYKNETIIPDATVSLTENINNFLTFSTFDNKPTVRLCNLEAGKKCEYMEVCNIYICKHLTNDAKIHNDKNTLKNVTYIHVYQCIVVFISKNENICSKEQDVSLEDINYINAYTSKHPDYSVFIVFYEKETNNFKDFNNKIHNEMRISLCTDNELTREILQPLQQSNNLFSPSAPTESRLFQQHRPDNQGNFFYIGK